MVACHHLSDATRTLSVDHADGLSSVPSATADGQFHLINRAHACDVRRRYYRAFRDPDATRRAIEAVVARKLHTGRNRTRRRSLL